MATQTLNDYCIGVIDHIEELERQFFNQQTDSETIHELRVSVRRLRPALKLLIQQEHRNKPRKQLKIYRGQLSTLFKILSHPRDLQVQYQLATTFADELPEHQLQWQYYIEQLKSELTTLNETLAREVKALELPTALEQLSHYCHHSSHPKAAQKRLNAQCKQYRHNFKRSLIALKDDPERFHRSRIQLKKYRYALEPRGNLTKHAKPKKLQRLKSLQDQLGDAHDLFNAFKLMCKYELGADAVETIYQRYITSRDVAIKALLSSQ